MYLHAFEVILICDFISFEICDICVDFRSSGNFLLLKCNNLALDKSHSYIFSYMVRYTATTRTLYMQHYKMQINQHFVKPIITVRFTRVRMDI